MAHARVKKQVDEKMNFFQWPRVLENQSGFVFININIAKIFNRLNIRKMTSKRKGTNSNECTSEKSTQSLPTNNFKHKSTANSMRASEFLLLTLLYTCLFHICNYITADNDTQP